MFERYTEKARRVIFFGRYEASQLGSPYIETEHLLLGLLREDIALTNRFLHSHASVESIRKQIDEHTAPREKVATSVNLPFSNESKRVLAYSAEEAEKLGHKHIGTEHLLLGLLREEKCFATKILEERGLKLDQTRDELAREPHKSEFRSILGATAAVIPAFSLRTAGVTITRPETCVIDPDVEVAPGTVIEPFVQLLGRTRVGAGCRIRSFSVIENCTLGNGVLIRQSCVLEDSTIADGAQIGPFAHLRPGSEIGENAHVGNFVETKKTRLGKGAKASHLTYLGDAEIGEGTNIGAGTITCNYDGVNKNITRIGKGAFIGSDSTLVAPVNVGDGAYIGAGSCITKNVPADALAIGRAKQANIEGWAAARRAKRPPKQP
ncbi:MAG: Clp protease N-terminal domain-containing protein [Terracidiphilus sp.]|jgi:bifunctional UDP-N-acetylglucosamine pyrophosphorylase/glucosamine-1-phosphate N-acetyltransferase